MSFQAFPFVCIYLIEPLLQPEGQVNEPSVLIDLLMPRCSIDSDIPSGRGTTALKSSSFSLFSYLQVPSSSNRNDIRWKKHLTGFRAPPEAMSNLPQLVIFFLQVEERLLLSLILVHSEVNQICVVNVDDTSDVARKLGDGTNEVCPVSLPLVCLNDTDDDLCPSRWRGVISLA